MTEIVDCADCDWVTEATRKLPRYQWQCLRQKRIEGNQWDPPYMFCRHINGGACPDLKPRRTGKVPE